MAAAGPVAAYEETLEVETYFVDAATADDLRRQMTRRGPIGFWGFAEWYVAWTGSCEVSLRIAITLPEHKFPSRMNPDLRQRWDRMLDALSAHENDHADMGRNAAREIEAAGCDEAYAIVDRWIEADDDLDRRTDHGRLDGVVLE